MELQWPLALFTTFLAWSAGVFATQGIMALKKKGAEVQLPLTIISAILLVIGGIAVFFHLEHWERIFNGFGHITSGITQELIVIVVMVIVGIVYVAMLRRNENQVPAWCAVCAIVVSVALIIVMAHSYMMAARPAWDSVFWIIAVLGNACVLGPLTVTVYCTIKKTELVADTAQLSVIGTIVNLATTLIYGIVMHFSLGAVSSIADYYDPTHPTASIAQGTASPITGESALIMWIGAIIIGSIIPVVCALVARKSNDWKVWGAVALGTALIGVICLRVAFYSAGVSVFEFF